VHLPRFSAKTFSANWFRT